MQTKGNAKPQVEAVKKPIVTGSWHGRDAWKLALKRMLSVLAISLVYLIAGVLLSFDSLLGRVACCVAIVGLVAYYEFHQGMVKGEGDAAYGEIMYVRQAEGKEISVSDRERCFHPMKGFFASAVGAAPFVLIALVFAFITKPAEYTLGLLPSWTSGMLNQSEFGDALAYYNRNVGMGAADILRVIDRAMVMPFINVASYISDAAALTVERLSPLLVLIAPAGYGLGYTQGLVLRTKINTGIKMGDDKKKRKERKARKQRQRSSTPQRLI